MKISNAERRKHRRADLERHGLQVQRWDGSRKLGKPFGQIIDISAGGVRLRTEQKNIRPDSHIRLRLALPDYAGISPFLSSEAGEATPKNEWVGWLSVSRVMKIDGKQQEVAGRLVDMEDMDRGMLGLYLSTQPMAA